jgi:proline iminopeptidase
MTTGLQPNRLANNEFVESVSISDGSLWTCTSGQGGVGLLLCHGGPGMSDNLSPVAAMVDDLVVVHRFDQRACGLSSGASTGQSLESAIGDIERLREHWGYDRWIVGGHSWGAALSLFYSLMHPDRVWGIVYLSGVGKGDGPRLGVIREQRAVRARRLERLSESEQIEFSKLRSSEDPKDVARFAQLMWLSDFADRSKAPDFSLHPLFDFPHNAVAARSLAYSATNRAAEFGFADELASLNVPVIVAHGSDDPVPYTGAADLAELLPQARFSLLPDVGHDPWLEDPDTLRNVLREFITPLA